MPGFCHFVLCFCVLGCMVCCSDAWDVQLPNQINALLGSCLIIPCSFDYHQYPPQRPNRVVWYQYENRGYPLVYDNWYPKSVISAFRGKTYVYTSKYSKTCSLKIDPVTWDHHRRRIYPWVDPENVGKSTYRFFDKTVTINVQTSPNPPEISIFGQMKVGQSVTVQCRVRHTCEKQPPSLSLNIPLVDDQLEQTSGFDGQTTTTLKSTLLIERDHQTVTCTARHAGHKTATGSYTLSAECSMSQLTISPTDEFLEGRASKVSCTASYTCSKHIPTLTWNYDMPSSTDTVKVSEQVGWRTVSTLTFTASANDYGRSLTCYASFSGGQKQETSITLRVERSILSRGWSFTSPRSLTGMRGSCIIIPCSFSYSNRQPSDLSVMWYLYQRGDPVVFDQRTSNIDRKFAGKTSLVGSVQENNCSLKIERLEMSHDRDQLYPWIDENRITSYSDLGQMFFDKTTQLLVSDHADAPQLSIVGNLRVGEQSRVTCSVRHTCLSAAPSLAISDISGTDKTTDALVSDGVWKRTTERTWTVEEENRAVTCTVSHPGGQKASSNLRLNVECPYDKITMEQSEGRVEATEGVAKHVVCTVSYKCQKNRPTIVWNYRDMHSSPETRRISGNSYLSVSNLTFIGSAGDNGKTLTCTARFGDGETSDSATIRIKPFDLLAADVPLRFNALARSCVVIPCSFQSNEDLPMTRGIWTKKNGGGVVYHNGQSQVLNHFKGRTRMLGNLREGNCSLEMDNVKPFDNGPFCFHAERENYKHQFNNSCVFLLMKASPDKPVMTPVPEEVDAGSTVTVSCSVEHTCPTHPPEFSWSVPTLTSEVSHASLTRSLWETTSTVTFVAAGGDGVRSLNCTATFWRGQQQASVVSLNVKGSLRYQLKTTAPVFVPTSLLVLVIVVLAVLGVCIWRKRRNADDSLRPPPRPEKRRSLWDRLSRRYPDERDRPPRPEKRKSLWDRFSRSPDDRVGWGLEKKARSNVCMRQNNAYDLRVGYINNTSAVTFDSDGAKPRCPSPKRKQIRY
ncbi:unnamed protein product [Ophioblennius macclurei]